MMEMVIAEMVIAEMVIVEMQTESTCTDMSLWFTLIFSIRSCVVTWH